MSQERRGGWSWEIFVGIMFIGLGLGQILGDPGAGVLFGMGFGFILASLIRIESGKISITPPKTLVGLIFVGIGLFFIMLGLWTLGYIPIVALRYVEAVASILFGILLIIGGLKLIRF